MRRFLSGFPGSLIAFLLVLVPLQANAQINEAERDVALSLATMLQSARGVIGANQDLINDPDIAEKGLSGEKVLSDAIAAYLERTGTDPRAAAEGSVEAQLLDAQMEAIAEVIDENQEIINRAGLAFKGFVPAVFARLVNERFAEKAGHLAVMKVTAPRQLVRNRKARPDDWEANVIETRLTAADWPEGQIFEELTEVEGRPALRVLVPEYYGKACLSCHGTPAGEIDVTGYPKEGGELGDLGGAISITLYR